MIAKKVLMSEFRSCVEKKRWMSVRKVWKRRRRRRRRRKKFSGSGQKSKVFPVLNKMRRTYRFRLV
jgi:hypothetical protein